MSHKLYKQVKFVSFIELSDDVDELLELLGQSDSLNIQAENELALRKTERSLIKRRLKKVRQEANELHITDHAIVRYLERVVGIDIEACKKEMLSKLPEDLEVSDEVAFVKISTNELQYVIRDNLIISVTPGKDEQIGNEIHSNLIQQP